jgi:hypothetical protein
MKVNSWSVSNATYGLDSSKAETVVFNSARRVDVSLLFFRATSIFFCPVLSRG